MTKNRRVQRASRRGVSQLIAPSQQERSEAYPEGFVCRPGIRANQKGLRPAREVEGKSVGPTGGVLGPAGGV